MILFKSININNDMNKIFFIFNTKDGYHLVESKDVESIPKPRELIRRATAVEVLREFADEEGITFTVDKARKRSKHTAETKKKIGDSVRANQTRTKNGISEEHRQNIIKHHTGKYRGENNNMYGKQHRYTTKLKMAEAARNREPYRYISNKYCTLQVDKADALPTGWQEGKTYDPYLPD